MNNLTFASIILVLLFAGCDDSKSKEVSQPSQEVITHDIDALGASGFFYNLSSQSEVDSSATWHISFQMIPVVFGEVTYMMPSLILGSTAYAAEYTNIAFEDLNDTPDSFMDDYFQDASAIQYSGPNEVLQYNMQTHTVSVKDPNRVFVFYELSSHSTYKVQFIDYASGIIVFKYGIL